MIHKVQIWSASCKGFSSRNPMTRGRAYKPNHCSMYFTLHLRSSVQHGQGYRRPSPIRSRHRLDNRIRPRRPVSKTSRWAHVIEFPFAFSFISASKLGFESARVVFVHILGVQQAHYFIFSRMCSPRASPYLFAALHGTSASFDMRDQTRGRMCNASGAMSPRDKLGA